MDDNHQRDGDVIKHFGKHGVGDTCTPTCCLKRGNLRREFRELFFHLSDPLVIQFIVCGSIQARRLSEMNHDLSVMPSLFCLA